VEGSASPELAGIGEDASEEPAGEEDVFDAATGQPVAVDTALATAVMSHYCELESGLPTDLSRYERKVATYEISVQTAREFSLSLAEFKAIREMFSATD
jgi:hypothetical protein